MKKGRKRRTSWWPESKGRGLHRELLIKKTLLFDAIQWTLISKEESRTSFNLRPPRQNSDSRLEALYKFGLLLNKQLSHIYLGVNLWKCEIYVE